ncbi:FAD/FMN-containing isoamyl alcohol oxidase-like protein MreA [Amniculicola lignicola CBS 123094]|uniref:FAD/FMN-containing isoamyl alcohol oxidase-like protein MreA n=1 Tax=Amniculicola lignicola CBS 123094 TaxID=1392246 RepID=A0A6A5WTM2_9PLEO|nr:FAD/FMN-containing isoamyl alcohol oxidase-like protein MreA [Amniculicola lignicola CBS 123094]
MAIKSLLPGAVALSLFLFSFALAQSPIISASIEPAATTVPSSTVAGAPLLEVETVQLTEAVIARIENDLQTTDYAKLFAFDSDAAVEKRNLPACKTYPGDWNWPIRLVWDLFDMLLGGALIPTVPIAAPCYDSKWGPKDQAKCNEIVATFSKPFRHEDDPTSVMWPIFQGKTCLARNNTTPADTCTLGGFPEYAVKVENVAQVQLAVNFARTTNIRLVIKNTGHCYLGKSAGAGSLSLWMHNLKEIEFLPNYRTKGYTGKAFKVGAGVTVQEIYRAAEAQNTVVQGGICEASCCSVGYVGGYLQGGGHNPLSGKYGMAADGVLAFQVVTADGRFVTASETSHPDLFWALRGGGGGTFGVVVSATVKAFPNTQVTKSSFVLGNTTTQTVSQDVFWKGVRKYWESFPEYTDAGTYSFFFLWNRGGQLSLDMRAFFAPGHTPESLNKLLKPWFDLVNDLGIPFATPPNTTHYDTFFPAYWATWGQVPFPLGTSTSLPGNRLIPRSFFTDGAKLNATFNQVKAHVLSGRHFVCYHQAPGNPTGADNAVSSAWRNAQAFLVTQSPAFAEGASQAEIRAADQTLQNVILAPWRQLAGASQGGGSYLNEATVMEPSWQSEFYGTQYPKLVDIKKQYDPKALFYVTTGVASDEWEVRDGEMGVQTQFGKLCRV